MSMRPTLALRQCGHLCADLAPFFREHAKLLTKGDNNAADDTELCMSTSCLRSGGPILIKVYRRERSGLSGAAGYHRQCWYVLDNHWGPPVIMLTFRTYSGIHSICGIRDNHVVRAPLDEDCYVGNNGSCRRLTTGVISNGRIPFCSFSWTIKRIAQGKIRGHRRSGTTINRLGGMSHYNQQTLNISGRLTVAFLVKRKYGQANETGLLFSNPKSSHPLQAKAAMTSSNTPSIAATSLRRHSALAGNMAMRSATSSSTPFSMSSRAPRMRAPITGTWKS